MAGNELGRARISMMARSISSNTRPDTLVRDHRLQSHDFPLQRTAGPYIGVKRFQAIHHHNGEVARGLTLLYGIGTWPFHYGIRGRGGTIFRATLPGGRSKRTHELTSSIVPRGTPFHRVVELEFPPVVIGFTSASCCCSFSGPSELGAISPDAVHDNGQPSRQRDNRSFHPAPSGNLHRPGLEPRPFCRT